MVESTTPNIPKKETVFDVECIFASIFCNVEYGKARAAYPQMANITQAYEDGQNLKNYLISVLKIPEWNI